MTYSSDTESRLRLHDALRRRILVLDGAMGTMIQSLSLREKDFRRGLAGLPESPLAGCNDLLCLSSPQNIREIHLQYLAAGADIISTNTFSSNALSLEEYGISGMARQIARAGARIAREAALSFISSPEGEGRERPFVAGSMGPSGMSLSLAAQQDQTDCAAAFRRMEEAYLEQALGLIEGGADILMLETAFDTLSLKAAIRGVYRAMERYGARMPLWISATLSQNGRLLSGQSLEAFIASISHAEADIIGLNCGFGAKALNVPLRHLSEIAGSFVSVHPNAGLPDALGHYSETPEEMALDIADMAGGQLVNIVGGCCGTTPRHIGAIARHVRISKPRPLPVLAQKLTVSATEAFDFGASGGTLVKIGERCNVAGSRKFLRLASEGNWEEALEIAASQIRKGAVMLDINTDDAMLDAAGCMCRFTSLLSSGLHTAGVPLMIDSSDFSVIARTLRQTQGKCIVNSISLKNGEDEFIHRAREIRSLGAAAVVMAFDEEGQADTFSRRIEICSRAYRMLTEDAEMPPCDIIFDPNILAVATGVPGHERYALDFLETISWIKANLPGAKVSGGVSNLSFSFRGNNPVRKAMHSLFLHHAAGRGMDMAIVDPATPLDAGWVDPELRELIDDVLLCRRPDATERLTLHAVALNRQSGGKTDRPAEERQSAAVVSAACGSPQSACGLLSEAVVEGHAEMLESLTASALKEKGTAMGVVGEALMAGMDRVGELFGGGKMYLPQVVRSAAVVKKAVEILTPVMETERDSGLCGAAKARPAMVLATVKGDVHDIGKNIVSIVMRCSGFNVIDLGVMVPAEKIVAAARESGAVCIGLSGLITPSLGEMADVARLMERHSLHIPLFVGGAATSALHTAVGIATVYSGDVVHTRDAASLPPAVRRFTNPDTCREASAALCKEQAELRRAHEASRNQNHLPGLPRNGVDTPAPAPVCAGMFTIGIRPENLLELVNWRAFLHVWGLAEDSEEAPRVIADARALIAEIPGKMLARVHILDARRGGDAIIVEHECEEIALETPRRDCPEGESAALCDYVATSGDHIGVFAVTASQSGLGEMYRDAGSDEYRRLLIQSASHRLAEAATQWLHGYVRDTLWSSGKEAFPRGIRPAVGYPSLPRQQLVFTLDRILDYSSMGITLTENGALSPSASTTGLLLFHPSARYF